MKIHLNKTDRHYLPYILDKIFGVSHVDPSTTYYINYTSVSSIQESYNNAYLNREQQSSIYHVKLSLKYITNNLFYYKDLENTIIIKTMYDPDIRTSIISAFMFEIVSKCYINHKTFTQLLIINKLVVNE